MAAVFFYQVAAFFQSGFLIGGFSTKDVITCQIGRMRSLLFLLWCARVVTPANFNDHGCIFGELF